jgi:hypothetical protein
MQVGLGLADTAKTAPETRFETRFHGNGRQNKGRLLVINGWKTPFPEKNSVSKTIYLISKSENGPKVIETSSFPVSPKTGFPFLPTLGRTGVQGT